MHLAECRLMYLSDYLRVVPHAGRNMGQQKANRVIVPFRLVAERLVRCFAESILPVVTRVVEVSQRRLPIYEFTILVPCPIITGPRMTELIISLPVSMTTLPFI